MATIGVANALGRFPAGTVVGLYQRAQARPDRAGPPSGTATTTATVDSGGALSFTGVAEDVAYIAYASVGGEPRYMEVSTLETGPRRFPVFASVADGDTPAWDAASGQFVGAPAVREDVTDAQTVLSRLNVQPPTGVAANFNGQLDGLNGADNNPYRVGFGLSTTNGVNSSRSGAGDSVQSDAANAVGASFYAGYYQNSTFTDRGTLTQYTAYGQINEVGAGGVYGEYFAFYANITSNRLGALTGGIECQNVIAAGKPARATSISGLMVENNTAADYSAANFGAQSRWIATGARIFNALSAGPQPVGVGYFARGDMLHYFRVHADQSTRTLLSSYVVTGSPALPEANARFDISTNGVMHWSSGGSTFDVNLFRASAGFLKTSGRLLATSGIGVGNAAAGSTPGTVVKKIQVYDDNGVSIGYLPVYDAIT